MISRITENKNETNHTYYLFDEDMILNKIELKTKEHNVVNNTKNMILNKTKFTKI